jgi:two-component system sensor histidine kinase EvgS
VTRHSLRERRGSLNILLVDASPTRRGTILRNLEPLGHRVEVAGNGALGLAAVTGGSYDAVVIDDEVGDLDSLALARAIRRWERGVPGRLRLVGMTQLGQALDERRYHAAGFDACVPRTAGIERLHAELVAD